VISFSAFSREDFARALLDPAAPPPCGLPERRFAVHRNNIVVSLVDALAERFPVVLRLVGEAFFRAMAGVHVRAAPPRSPILAEYGATFPSFIEGFEPARDLPYLADVARLDYAFGMAYHAADATPLTLGEIASFPAESVAEARIELHPSLQLVASRHPIVAIWRMNALGAPLRDEDLGRAQDALVARNGRDVGVWELPAGGRSFTCALAQGATVSEAAIKAAADTDAFDLIASLAMLFSAGAIVAIEPRAP
jgi:hypothetical protein